MKPVRLVSALMLLASAGMLAGCAGAAVGAGASAGVAAAEERGLEGALEDTKIRAAINEAWFRHDVEMFRKVTLTISQGRVLLTGVVPTEANSADAVRLVWQVPGVREVYNEVLVRPAGSALIDDGRDLWIQQELKAKLLFDKQIRNINYTVDVASLREALAQSRGEGRARALHQSHVGVRVGREDLDMYQVRTIRNYHFVGTAIVLDDPPVATDHTSTDPHIRPHRRLVSYLYAQDEWRFIRDWTLTAGMRHDRYSDFGGTTNPRLALAWEAAYDLTARLLYGRAFRAPSFNDLYGINPVNNSNANLRPETIATTEAALSWQARKDLQLNLSLFRYDARDLIRLLSNTYSNIGSVHGSGLEVEASWDTGSGLRLTGNYSHQRSIDNSTGRDAGYAPRHHLYLRADSRVTGDWLGGAQLNWVADRKRAAGDARPDVADYRTVDLTLRTTRRDSPWQFVASIRNLFNSQVLEPSLPPAANLPDDLPPDELLARLAAGKVYIPERAERAAASFFSTSVERRNTGAPERPPVSSALGRPSTPSRESVVLVAMTPSMRWRRSASAMAAIWASSRSGAILRVIGTYLPCCCARRSWRAFSCASRSSRASSFCSSRKFLVLGEEIFTVT